MSPEQSAAYINAQTHMMINEREIMYAENKEREFNNFSPAYGSEEWSKFYDRWNAELGANAVISFFNAHNYYN